MKDEGWRGSLGIFRILSPSIFHIPFPTPTGAPPASKQTP